MILKLFTYLFVCCIKARSQVLFILLPQCVEINKLLTDTLEDRQMNELILGGQMDGAGQKAPLGPLSFSKDVPHQVLEQMGGNPPSHLVTSGLKCYCPCLPSFERHMGGVNLSIRSQENPLNFQILKEKKCLFSKHF